MSKHDPKLEPNSPLLGRIPRSFSAPNLLSSPLMGSLFAAYRKVIAELPTSSAREQLQEKMKTYKNKEYLGAPRYRKRRHALHLLSDRSLSIFFVSVSIFALVKEQAFSAIVTSFVTTPLVIVTGLLLLFTAWEQYSVYRKQKQAQHKYQEVNKHNAYSDSEIDALKTKLKDLGIPDAEIAAAINAGKIMKAKRKTIIEQEKNAKKPDPNSLWARFASLNWITWWKRSISPAARTAWVAVVLWETMFFGLTGNFTFFNLLSPNGITLILAGVAAFAVAIPTFYFSKAMHQEKLDETKKIDDLKDKRWENKEVLKTLEKLYFQTKLYKDNLGRKIKCQPEVEIELREKVRDNIATPETKPEIWFYLHMALAVLVIIPSLGIGSSMISMLGRIGLKEMPTIMGSTAATGLFFGLAAMVTFLSFCELVKSFRDTQEIKEKVDENVAKIKNLQDGINSKLEIIKCTYPWAIHHYEKIKNDSVVMAIYEQYDSPHAPGVTEQHSGDYLGIKVFRKAGYKAGKAFSAVTIAMAFGIIPGGWIIPVATLVGMTIFGFCEYWVKTDNRCTLNHLVHQEKWLRQIDAALGVAIEVEEALCDSDLSHFSAGFSLDNDLDPGPNVHFLIEDEPEPISAPIVLARYPEKAATGAPALLSWHPEWHKENPLFLNSNAKPDEPEEPKTPPHGRSSVDPKYTGSSKPEVGTPGSAMRSASSSMHKNLHEKYDSDDDSDDDLIVSPFTILKPMLVQTPPRRLSFRRTS